MTHLLGLLLVIIIGVAIGRAISPPTVRRALRVLMMLCWYGLVLTVTGLAWLLSGGLIAALVFVGFVVLGAIINIVRGVTSGEVRRILIRHGKCPRLSACLPVGKARS